jgi:ABC-type amino acid transport substrate-binding protein
VTPQAKDAQSAKSAAKSSPPSGDDLSIGPLRIDRASRPYRTIAALLTVAAAICSATYGFATYVEISPLKDKLKDNEAQIASLEKERQSLSTQLDRLERKIAEITKDSDKPLLTYPADGSSIIGSDQMFTWEYSKLVNGYVFELRSLSNPGQPVLRQNVVRPEIKRVYFSLPKLDRGEYLWRIAPGMVVKGELVAQGAWSNPSTFSVFPDTLARIRATGDILVATTPTSYDAFVASNGLGQYSGFEMELVSSLSGAIAKKLGIAIPNIKTVEVPWSGLMSTMQNGEADMAVRSIVRTRSREAQYPGLKFSRGYISNSQIVVSTRDNLKFPDALRGSVVAVKANTFNERAAVHVSQKFGFRVDNSYTNYGDIYQALREGRAAFAIVDSVLAAQFLKSDGRQLGPSLDSELRGLYKKELFSDGEEYVVVIHERASSGPLLAIINEILSSPEFNESKKRLLKKYGLP